MTAPATPRSDLMPRVGSALVLMAVALAAVMAGGVIFALLVAAGAAMTAHEWTRMSGPFTVRRLGLAVVFLAGGLVLLAAFQGAMTALGLLAAALVVMGLAQVVESKAVWAAGGLAYAALPGIAAVVLRGTAPAGELSPGLVAIAFLFAVVWATDSGAYFAGRALGGPKLWPAVSPKKTWSGAIGGIAAAVAVGLLLQAFAGGGSLATAAVVAVVLSVVSQAGDLAESAMKRHFGVKDSGSLIPGHGGLMDRIDGLAVALVAALGMGAVAAGGLGLAGEGLLSW